MRAIIAIASLCLGTNALITTAERQKLAVSGATAAGKTKCPQVRLPLKEYCCESLDYSGMTVACVGPGRVEYFEQCLDYEPRPMCCCGIDPSDIPGRPIYIPAEISCDEECNVLVNPDDPNDEALPDGIFDPDLPR